MKINNIKYNNNYSILPRSNPKQKFTSKGLSDSINFTGKTLCDINLKKFKQMSFFQRFKYELLSFLNPAAKNDAKSNYIAAKVGLEYCNKEFKNYTLISIGRSMASIAEVMQAMGADVKLLPLSALHNKNLDINKISGVEKYKEFLKSINLTKEVIQNQPDKKFVIMDYVFSGNSLDNAYKFLTQENLLGKQKNIIKLSSNTFLDDIYDANYGVKFIDLLQNSGFKNYSKIGYLHIDNIDNLDRIKEAAYAPKSRYDHRIINKQIRKTFIYNIMKLLSNEKSR